MATNTDEEQVLESFRGKVERVDGDIAYLTLVDSRGQESFATYDATDLASRGISEGTRFTYTVKKRNNETVTTFELIPRRRLSDEEWSRIRQKAAEALGEIHDELRGGK